LPKRAVGEKDAAQIQRFKDKARELGSDESAESFDRIVKAVATHQPTETQKKNTKSGKR
jgi:hypothetical protein